MSITADQLNTAYRKLKSYVYYDKTDLKLRQRLAAFECSNEFDEKLQAVLFVVNSLTPSSHPQFQDWLQKITFRVVPKKINWDGNECELTTGKFITNVTSTDKIEVEKVNYFFDGPIELHLIAVIWIMQEGLLLDKQLGNECCGSRLNTSVFKNDDDSLGLFQKYHEQYSRWRDNGIKKAKQLLTEDKVNVAILGLDIQEYFYRIRLDFDSIKKSILEFKLADEVNTSFNSALPLTDCIREICLVYRQIISPFLQNSHKDIEDIDTGLPIGFCPSVILANWYLKCFDDVIIQELRPAYYGRYVDDILIVLPATKNPQKQDTNPVSAFIEEHLIKHGLLTNPINQRYQLLSRPGLYLQQGKCILQYFDRNHSIAGLEKFQKKLEQNGSDFLLMPVDEADNSIEDVAYEIMYEGSVNKFRSVKGMAENRYELAKHLARQTILHLLTDDRPDATISLGLRRFFKGKNAIEFFDLWERVFTFFAISDDPKAAKAFDSHLTSEIKKVSTNSGVEIKTLLIDGLLAHLELAKSMSQALCESDWGFVELIPGYEIEVLRNSNLIRHHFIRKPLLNYTNYSGPITTWKIDKPVDIDKRKLELSPRYINFDECMLLACSRDVELKGMPPFRWASYIYEIANRRDPEGIEWQLEFNKGPGHDD
ncbi:reverse transcriptase domain-containing protein [Methylophilus sp. YYY-1]|uniref:reverse transcriptase domain-containing protein n=1 Tax=Methylophilus sp. YYY-1 TaxID=2682087 RepID=UPI0023B21CF1|nr:reverse transcriptase domain-containing protein [Methylophilus sp. YYY-1]MDF0377521.1 hypothetical protein [Methylophilus sp. YYY-1]